VGVTYGHGDGFAALSMRWAPLLWTSYPGACHDWTVEYEYTGGARPLGGTIVLEEPLRRSQRAADLVIEFCGSWTFVVVFSGLVIAWVTFDSLLVLFGEFDPYPYILLNLVLTVVSTFQGPLIMMSQQRQLERTDKRSGDYIICSMGYSVRYQACTQTPSRHLRHRKTQRNHPWTSELPRVDPEVPRIPTFLA
jgi:hypothetical protein